MSQFIRVLLFHCSDVIHPENTVKKKKEKNIKSTLNSNVS